MEVSNSVCLEKVSLFSLLSAGGRYDADVGVDGVGVDDMYMTLSRNCSGLSCLTQL